MNGNGKKEKYVYIDTFPCINGRVNSYLLQHKEELIERRIRKFTEKIGLNGEHREIFGP